MGVLLGWGLWREFSHSPFSNPGAGAPGSGGAVRFPLLFEPLRHGRENYLRPTIYLFFRRLEICLISVLHASEEGIAPFKSQLSSRSTHNLFGWTLDFHERRYPGPSIYSDFAILHLPFFPLCFLICLYNQTRGLNKSAGILKIAYLKRNFFRAMKRAIQEAL